MPGPGRTFLDLFSEGRAGPQPGRFTGDQIEHIRRTVRRTPEVMVKVTGGGRSVGAVAAHLGYISHHGELGIETDEAEQVSKDGQRALLRDWHLELSAGQYRMPKQGDTRTRRIKLVHNIVLSMPAPTPPHKILAAAKVFAREKFGATYRYAMVLHTHQQHPHVHLVVKAEAEVGRRRLHIDKAMLREWRQDFARTMREQGVPANATSRLPAAKPSTPCAMPHTGQSGADAPTAYAPRPKASQKSYRQRERSAIRRAANCLRRAKRS